MSEGFAAVQRVVKDALTRLWIVVASVFVMALAVLAIVGVHLLKGLRGLKTKDPFHDSRRHPLNSPDAPRG